MDNRRILTKYKPLRGINREQAESVFIDQGHSTDNNSWKHINDLDVFFKNAYLYHKEGGFFCKFLNKMMDVFQVIFFTGLTVALMTCLNYDVMFKNVPPEGMDEIPAKIEFSEIFYSFHQIWDNCTFTILLFILSSVLFILFKLWQTLVSILYFYNIKKFYEEGLHIIDNEIDSYTWEEVQKRLIQLQKRTKFCIQKEELDELDIHHRILRFTNYFIGMVNQNVIDLNLDIPCIGKKTYLSRGLKYNIELVLFWGPWSPFVNNWKLHDDFKRADKLRENADKIRNTFRLMGVINLILMVFILFWQVLCFFYSCSQYLKNQFLKFNKWSLFGEAHLRHFNELDHELELRLSKAFNPSMTYVKTFPSKRFKTFINHIKSSLGALFIIIVALTAWSAEVMQIGHIITVFTILSFTLTYCFDSLPGESDVHDPEKYLKNVIRYIKYAPQHWMGKAHTPKVKMEFSKLFENKFVYIFEDFISPIVTPYILFFKLPNSALAIADYLRKFTVEIEGVGDVCSFAHLNNVHQRPDLRNNRSLSTSTWIDSNTMRSFHRAETSLLGFTQNNRNWIPTESSAQFISSITDRSKREQIARTELVNSEDNFYLPNDLQSSDYQFSADDTMFESLRIFQRDSRHDGELRESVPHISTVPFNTNIVVERNEDDHEDPSF